MLTSTASYLLSSIFSLCVILSVAMGLKICLVLPRGRVVLFIPVFGVRFRDYLCFFFSRSDAIKNTKESFDGK